ncbi:MAG: fructosamine kinase family protein [Bacteroidetes bacterium]|nr:fructosamine kinase family protein [Bacteroidota bacterium]
MSAFFQQEQHVDFQILSSKPLGGGSINEVYVLNTTLGQFCLKYNNNASFPKMFETEASGLELLSMARAIKVPKVILQDNLTDYSFILLEFINSTRQSNEFFKNFGRSLTCLHRNKSELYGLDYNNYMGSLPQNNCYHSDWVDFFVEERLDKQVRLAIQKSLIDTSAEKLFEKLYLRLSELLPEEPACLVHGDLWSGNYIVSDDGKACLIDPAVYYGNREVDIAMSTLFGGFSPEFYTSYHEEYPLIQGWKERLDLYNLYPLLIHLNLFGSSYLGSILSTLRRF